MSSNGPRGGNNNPNSRYGDRHEYNEYGKVRKKNFYSSSSRRDFRAQLSGANKIALSGPGIRESSGTGSNNGINSPSINNGANSGNPLSRSSSAGNIASASGSQQPGKGTSSYSSSSYGNSGSSSYYPSYGGYSKKQAETGEYGSNFYGGSRGSGNLNEPWGNRGKSSLSTSRGSALSSTDYRKERYEYSDSIPNGSTRDNKWRSSSYGNRSSLSGSVGGRSYNKWGAYSSFGSKGSGSSALVNSTGGGKRNNLDPYAQSGGNRGSYSNTNSKFSVDRYSSTRSKDYVKKKSPRESSKDYHIDERNHTEENADSKDDNGEEFENGKKDTEIEDEDEVDNEPDNDLDNENTLDGDADGDADADSIINKAQEEDLLRRFDKEEEDLEGIEGDIMDEDEEDVDVEAEDDEDLGQIQSKVEETSEHKEENDVDAAVKPTPLVGESDDELYYPDGCNYPMGKLETNFAELKKEYEKNNNGLKYSLVKPVIDFTTYPCYEENLADYGVQVVPLKKKMVEKLTMIRKKKLSLWKDYESTFDEYTASSEKMDQQLRVLHPSDDEMRREIDSSDNRKTAEFEDYYTKPPPTSSRRSRRHGDLVTTDAEFEEVLKSLERQSDEDPLQKAQKVAAVIPDMILDPVERKCLVYMDANNAVADVAAWANRITYDFDTNFLEKEHELFTEGFCHHPKRYGAISRFMGGLRTPEDCVHYYYKTKKKVNYKQILIQHKKKANKRSSKRGKGRSRNSSQAQTAVITPPSEETPAKKTQTSEEIASSEVATQSISEATKIEGNLENSDTTPTTPAVDNGVNIESSKMEHEDSEESRKRSEFEEHELLKPTRKRRRKEDEGKKPDVVTDTNIMGPNVGEEIKDINGNGSKRSISSYWSINEVTQFPALLEEHGTKWTTIADVLGTKTATMVKNYYQRNAEKHEWLNVALAADARLDAKFAAVLNSEGVAVNEPTELYGKYPVAPVIAETPVVAQAQAQAHVVDHVPSRIPTVVPPPSTLTSFAVPPHLVGVPQTMPYVPSYESGPYTSTTTTYPVVPPPSSSAAPVASAGTIPAAGASPFAVVPAPHAHSRSTIMSLLNGPSPVKAEPEHGSQSTAHKSNVRSLLN